MDLTTIVILASICVFIGLLLGLLISSFKEQKSSSASTEEESDPNQIDIARLRRDKRTESLVLEVGGRTFLKAKDLPPSQRERLLGVASEWLKWLGPPRAEVSISQKSSSIAPETTPMGEERSAPSLKPTDVLSQALWVDVPQSVEKSQSIAAQIDAILQEKLKHIEVDVPGIRLMENPTKGVVVLVGLEQYESVEDVPDERIRGLIQESVAEWEATQSS